MKQKNKNIRIREIHTEVTMIWPRLVVAIAQLEQLGPDSVEGYCALQSIRDWLTELSKTSGESLVHNQKRLNHWQVDEHANTAIHESGLIVQFTDFNYDDRQLTASISGVVPESLNWRTNPKILDELIQQAVKMLGSNCDKRRKDAKT